MNILKLMKFYKFWMEFVSTRDKLRCIENITSALKTNEVWPMKLGLHEFLDLGRLENNDGNI